MLRYQFGQQQLWGLWECGKSQENAVSSSHLLTTAQCITGSTCSSSTCVCTNSGKPPRNGQCPGLTSGVISGSSRWTSSRVSTVPTASVSLSSSSVQDQSSSTTSTTSTTSSEVISQSSSTTTSQSPPVSASSVTSSSLPSGTPGTCLNYTASCFDVMNGILATNSIASPQLVDYRMQTAILGITSPSDFLAALGPDPCQTYTDPTEHDTCVSLVANSEFVSQLTDITIGVLTAFQECASDYATGGPDYQVVINEPGNATCGDPNSVRRHVKRFGEDHDLTQLMLGGIEHYRMTAPAPVLGRMKSSPDPFQLVRKQQSTCSQTGTCFETCPDCRDQQTYCGSSATLITTAVCGGLAAIVNAGVGTLAASACGAACGPAAPLCATFCGRAAGGLSAVVVGSACAVLRSSICDPLTQRCANCNSANNGICDAGSTQCCAGETGTSCGADCCCCPQCQAPGGINCACTAAPC